MAMKTALAVTLSLVATVSAAQASTQPYLDSALKTFLQRYTRISVSPEDPTLRVAVATVDLRGDGGKEILVYLSGRYWCGTGGCPLLVLVPSGALFKVISKTTITRPPIRVLPTRSHGWSDLGVIVVGGGITRAYVAKLPFDGAGYAQNPTMAPARRARDVHGTIAIPADAPGEPLFP